MPLLCKSSAFLEHTYRSQEVTGATVLQCTHGWADRMGRGGARLCEIKYSRIVSSTHCRREVAIFVVQS